MCRACYSKNMDIVASSRNSGCGRAVDWADPCEYPMIGTAPESGPGTGTILDTGGTSPLKSAQLRQQLLGEHRSLSCLHSLVVIFGMPESLKCREYPAEIMRWWRHTVGCGKIWKQYMVNLINNGTGAGNMQAWIAGCSSRLWQLLQWMRIGSVNGGNDLVPWCYLVLWPTCCDLNLGVISVNMCSNDVYLGMSTISSI